MNTALIKQLPHGNGLDLPAYATPLSAGLDVRAAISEPLTLEPGQRRLIPCGFSLVMPHHLEAQIRPRSGLALKHGLTVLNAPGTIDADYHGEVGVILINHGQEAFIVERGMRIAQMVFAAVQRISWTTVDDLDEHTTLSDRQASGFGSTGVR